MNTKILVTLGPSSLNKKTVEDLSSKGIYLFRINLSHTNLNDLDNIIKKVKSPNLLIHSKRIGFMRLNLNIKNIF